MRLWHWKLIPYLPKSQLLSQWRELNSIYKNQPRHILINYVYEYPKQDLFEYSNLVLKEMLSRGYKVTSTKNFVNYFGVNGEMLLLGGTPFKMHHDHLYLSVCVWNLCEKYVRGQKDFTDDVWDKIDKDFGNIIRNKEEK